MVLVCLVLVIYLFIFLRLFVYFHLVQWCEQQCQEGSFFGEAACCAGQNEPRAALVPGRRCWRRCSGPVLLPKSSTASAGISSLGADAHL